MISSGKMSNDLLSVEQVSVHFGGLVAIEEMTFTVKEGELVALIGPNGAGKTTAFNVITGFMKPTGGRVYFKGTMLAGLKPYQVTKLGLVRTFQRTSVFQDSSVFDNLLIALHRRVRAGLLESLLGLPGAASSERELRKEAWRILELVRLSARASEIAGALAYGEQRLLGVALALATKPSMLLLDEPVSGMNASETMEVTQLLYRLRKIGITILLVEHDMSMVMDVSERVLVLDHGTIIAEGPPSAIQNDPAVIAAYLGHGAEDVRSS